MTAAVPERLIEWMAAKFSTIRGWQAEEQASKGAESPYSREVFAPI
jgi:hypothetical protein